MNIHTRNEFSITLSSLIVVILNNCILDPQIPAGIQSLSKIKILGLSGNQFSTFPTAICELLLLEKLYLGQDQGIKLASLPQTISQLTVRMQFYTMYFIKCLSVYV